MAEGESESPKKKKKDGDIHFREHPDVKKAWTEAADAEGRSLANWLRAAANYRMKHPPAQHGVTVESVKEEVKRPRRRTRGGQKRGRTSR